MLGVVGLLTDECDKVGESVAAGVVAVLEGGGVWWGGMLVQRGQVIGTVLLLLYTCNRPTWAGISTQGWCGTTGIRVIVVIKCDHTGDISRTLLDKPVTLYRESRGKSEPGE